MGRSFYAEKDVDFIFPLSSSSIFPVRKFALLLGCLGYFIAPVFSQNPLNQKISIKFENEKVEDALDAIADAGGFNFSYNPEIVSVDRRVGMSANSQPVKAVLKEVLGESMNYKVRGSYVIIQKSTRNQPKQTFKIKGEIKDAKTGKKIEDVTIYEADKLKSTLSNKEGKYDLTVSKNSEYVNVAISKKNYQDTVIRVSKVNPLPPIITLTPIKNIETDSTDLLESSTLVGLFVSPTLSKHSENVELVEEKPFQISLLPLAGTNHKMSGKVTNKTSINILAGYSQAVEGVEIGGLLNIVKKDVKGTQIGGFANYVGKEVDGLQIGGFFNAVGGKVEGFQIAGFSNLTKDTVIGTQLSGFVNTAKVSDGFQLSGYVNYSQKEARKLQLTGLANYTKDLKGLQISGLGNMASGKMNGAQLAGAINLTSRDASGFQIGGVTNIIRGKLNGWQLSGLGNYAGDDVKGFQLSGNFNIVNGDLKGGQISFLNYAQELRGFQLGIVNIADSIVSGVNIGLFNYVKSGLHKFEYSFNDATHHNLAFKTGTYKFYNILNTSYRFAKDLNVFGFGYGLGTQYNFKNKTFLNLETTGSFLFQEDARRVNGTNILVKLNLNYGYRIGKYLSLSGGPLWYTYYSDMFNPDTSTYGFDIATRPFKNKTSIDGDNLKMWIGWQVGATF